MKSEEKKYNHTKVSKIKKDQKLKKIVIKRMRIKIKIKNKLDENYNFFNRC